MRAPGEPSRSSDSSRSFETTHECSRLDPSPPDKEVFEDVVFVVGGGERFPACRAMDEVIGEARLRFYMHDLVARPAPGADEIDPMAVGHAPSHGPSSS
jgi:hypothetical protein